MSDNNTWVRLDPMFPQHHKTHLLEVRLGDKAIAYLIRLWCWASGVRDSGDLKGIDPMFIEAQVCKWDGKPGELIKHLVECGFIDRKGRGIRLHGFGEHQAHALKIRKMRSEAAKKRWNSLEKVTKSKRKAPERTENKSLEESEPAPIEPVTSMQNDNLDATKYVSKYIGKYISKYVGKAIAHFEQNAFRGDELKRPEQTIQTILELCRAADLNFELTILNINAWCQANLKRAEAKKDIDKFYLNWFRSDAGKVGVNGPKLMEDLIDGIGE